MAVRQFNNRPRPRCIAMGFTREEFAVLEAVLPDVRDIHSIEDVHQEDWDLLIAANQNLPELKPHLFVIAFGGSIVGKTDDDKSGLAVRREYFDEDGETRGPVSVAVEFSTPKPVPGPFESLIMSDLVPALVKEHWHSGLLIYRPTEDGIGEPSCDIPGDRLIVGSDGAVYAVHFRRPGGKSWLLSLPREASFAAWVQAAVTYWHSIDPKRFPGTLDWTNNAIDWLTPPEYEAFRSYADARDEKEKAEAASAAAWDHFLEVRIAARAGPMRLLTDQGEDLVAAVRDALGELGLSVRDMDAEMPADDFVEDLRISPPDRPDWIALVEVKGYTKSRGQAGDLLKLTGRFGNRYRTAEGRDADAYWYIVNHEMGTDPSARQPVLNGSDKDVDMFASLGGLAIDTVALFRLWRDVAEHKISPEEARALLVGVVGRLTYESARSAD